MMRAPPRGSADNVTAKLSSCHFHSIQPAQHCSACVRSVHTAIFSRDTSSLVTAPRLTIQLSDQTPNRTRHLLAARSLLILDRAGPSLEAPQHGQAPINHNLL
eukprot:6208617-Pleurochrysis_carterae.AAC.5